jgi:hypothetical protein
MLRVALNTTAHTHHSILPDTPGTLKDAPIIVANQIFSSAIAPFAKLQAVPQNAQPVTLQPDRDAAFEFVTKQIRQVAMELSTKRKKQREQAKTEEAIARYRQQFEEFAADGEISFGERFVLNKLKQELNLSDGNVQTIEQNVLRPPANQQALDQYRKFFEEAIVKYGYPCSEKIAGDLKLVQTHLGLTDTDVSQVEAPIIAKKEAEQQEQQQLQQQQLELERQQDEERQRREQEQAEQLRRQEEAKRQFQREAEELRRQQQLQEDEKQRLTASGSTRSNIQVSRFEFEVVTVDPTGKEVNRSRKQAEFFVEDLGNGVILEMVAIPGGTFLMGSPTAEEGHWSKEEPQHDVTIQPFYMGKFTVTQAQWLAIAALPKVNIDLYPDPASFKGSDRPVNKFPGSKR